MTSTFKVTTPLALRNLTTQARARDDLGLTTDESDAYVNRLIATCSDAISRFFNQRADQDGRVTIGRETILETWRPGAGESRGAAARPLILGRAPVAVVNSVTEDGVVTKRRIGNSDGAMDKDTNPTHLASAGGPEGGAFTSAYVGQAITVPGAGAGGDDLETTIASLIDDATVALASPALTTVSGAAYALDNPGFLYEVNGAGGMLWKLAASGWRTPFTAGVIAVDYAAGWTLPDPEDAEAAYTLPLDIEDACVMMVMRKNQQLREGEHGRLESESLPGAGSWKFALEKITWEGGLPSDVKALLTPYRRLHV